jgi:DNA replication protein DnaC
MGMVEIRELARRAREKMERGPGGVFGQGPTEPTKITSKRPQRSRLDQLNQGHHPEIAKAVKNLREIFVPEVNSGENSLGVLLVGGAGTGKTHIARAIYWAFKQQALNEAGELLGGAEVPAGRFYTANDLIMALDQNTSVSSLAPFYTGTGTQCPIVVIDDIGTEQNIPYVKNQQNELRQRYARFFDYACLKMHMVITSNLTFRELGGWLGERAWDRYLQITPQLLRFNFHEVGSYRQNVPGTAQPLTRAWDETEAL